jgi:tetratricopeptide (TPR) repeat protein
MRELAERPVVVVMLSKAAFDSQWVRDECEWAYNLYRRKPERLILPVAAGAYGRDDFDRLLYLESMKRIEGPGNHPYPLDEMIARTLSLLALTPAGQRPVAATPQPTESADDLLTQGKALLAQQKHTEVLAFLERATQLDPSSSEAWLGLGYVLGKLGRNKQSLAANEKALALDPNLTDAWSNKGTTLGKLKRYEEALSPSTRHWRSIPTMPTPGSARVRCSMISSATTRRSRPMTKRWRSIPMSPLPGTTRALRSFISTATRRH